MTVDEFREKIQRRAVVMDVGGFRPPDDPMCSWFGKVNFCLPGEIWPLQDGKPMYPLAQINLRELPFRHPRLTDIDFLSVFISSKGLEWETPPNGQGWCLRAYKTIEDLVPLQSADTDSSIKPFPMRPRVIEEDFPCWEDIPCECPEEVEDNYYDLFGNVSGFKIGGWPTLIQSEIFWAPLNQHPMNPEYVLQIDSVEKGNWMWGDNGVGYFGRGTVPDYENEWTFAWDCY